MGYTTEFEGQFLLDKPLTPEHAAYLRAFSETRRIKRDPQRTALRPDQIREAVGLPVGPEGCYFVSAEGYKGQEHDAPDVMDYNKPPADQPGLWCRWIPTQESTGIVWDGIEMFYCYVEWLEYLIECFLEPWGYTLEGQIQWQGEEEEDRGILSVKNNQVSTVSL